MALTLRGYTIAFILISFSLGVTTTVQSTFLNTYNTSLNDSSQQTLKELKTNVESNSVSVSGVKDDAGNVQTTLGVIGVGSQVAKTILSGIGQVPTIASVLVQNLGLSKHILALLSIPVAAVIWEIISYIRQFRT